MCILMPIWLGLFVYLFEEINDFIQCEKSKKIKITKEESQKFQSQLMTLAMIVIGAQRKELILDFTIEVIFK